MKPLFQLLRLPNVFTVVADILMGYLFVHSSLRPVAGFATLLLSSICLYWAGMVLNDLFDVEQDRRERPERPLPAGQIPLQAASWLGWGLLSAGVAAGWWAGLGAEPAAEMPWRSGIVATLIALSVVGYNGWFKQTLAGPWLMGACRTGNVLLGMSTGGVVRDYATPLLGYDAAQWAVAGGIGVYIAGVTWFARHESDPNSRVGLLVGIIIMVLGLAWLASFTLLSVCQAGRYDLTLPHRVWPLLVALLAVSVIRRTLTAAWHPTPARVQLAVKQCLISLILFDAAVCLAVRSPWGWSVLILSLVVPTLILGRWFYST